MKKIIILPLLFLGLIGWGQAQFIVQNGTKTEVYNNINTAITNAVAGDTLYLPGGGFTITNPNIDKTLHWVGHGHYPDSTQATMQTRITSALNFTGNCDNSSFEGIFFTSTLSFGSATDEAINIVIKRCRLLNSLNMRASTTGNPDLNFHISECVTSNLYANYGSNCLIEKSLIFGPVHYFVQALFSHNAFNVTNSNRVVYVCTNCVLNDNVFSHEWGLYNSFSNTYNNNIFQSILPFTPPSDSNSGSNNIINVGSSNIFTDISNSANIYTFSYDNDYHLKSGSTGTTQDGSTTGVSIEGAATDGTDAGIYGTTTPYKIVPNYPHINTAVIATQATNNQLEVNINAEAQNR